MSLDAGDEQRWNELQLAAQELEAQDAEYAKAGARMAGTMQEAHAAADALRAFETADAAAARGGGGAAPGEADSLVPLGLGLYARARISYGSGVIVGIGADASAERGVRAALDHVEARIKEIEVAAQDVNARRAELAKQGQLVRQEMDSVMRRVAGAAGPAAAAPAPAEGRA